MAFGAQDRADAIRWIEQAEGLDGSDYPPYEELEWQFGLPYGYVAERQQTMTQHHDAGGKG